MLVMLGAFIGAAVNKASHASHFVTSWYSMSSGLGSRFIRGSSASVGCSGNSVVQRRLHFLLCVTAGISPSPLDRAGDVYTCFLHVHFQKSHMFRASASSVSFK